ncbi:MAG TPA: hypothetical protein VFC37_07000 [Terracidiphilus sp.]|jgi:hypothetical protein|nr:hypothetical protein [Terracidiphilus sp.]
MKSLKVMVLLLLLLPTVAAAQKKGKKPSIPEAFDHARYVYVEAIDGDEFKRGLYTADRLAIADVKDALKKWGRYTLIYDRENADLVFVVRKGRLTSARAGGDMNDDQDPMGGGPMGGQQGGGRGPGQQRTRGPELGVGGEIGPEDDLLEVRQTTPNGKLSGPIWTHTFANGLNAPRLILFTQLKDEIEKTYPRLPASTPAKP